MSIQHLLKIREAKALISDPKHWTQKVSAKDKDGNRTEATYGSAVCWCSAGALEAVIRGNDQLLFGPICSALNEAVYELDTKIASLNPRFCYIDFNDAHTHAEVMAMWELAEKKLEAQL